MKIHVASFFEPENHAGRLFSIAVSQPKGFNLPRVKCLVPSWKLVSRFRRGKIDEEGYSRQYEEQVLKHLTPTILRRHVLMLTNNTMKEVTLLCWEKEGEFCHRVLVYEWLKKWKKEKLSYHAFVWLGELH